MSDATALPIVELLAPLPGDAPAGQNLRADEARPDDPIFPALRTIRELARDASKKERTAGDSGEDPTFAGIKEWQQISEQGQAIFRETSKDLEVAALLVEAHVRMDGVGGLAEGFEFLAGLVERYWTDLVARVPAADPEQNEEARIEALLTRPNQWNEALPLPIARIPITFGGDAGEFALWQYNQAIKADEKNLSAEEREQRKTVSVDQFTRSVVTSARSRPADLLGLLANLDRAHAAAERVETAFQDRLTGALSIHAPSLGKVKDCLDDIKRCLEHTGKDELAKLRAAGADQAGGSGTQAAGSGGKPGQFNDREQAFQELSRIADFFARTEPLSLLAEQIRQVVHRGRLSPDQYYKELIDNEESLKQFFRLVGIKPSEGESS